MYLVEIEVGKEELYRSADALGAAIRRGEVSPRSRIFHRASSRWIPITVHPEYRKAFGDQQSDPLPPLLRRRWTYYALDPGDEEPEAERTVVERPPDRPEPPAATESAPRQSNGGWRMTLGRAMRSLSAAPGRRQLPDA